MLTRTTRKDQRGRRQRARSKTGRSRQPDLSRFYGRQLAPVVPGEFRFELALLRPGKPLLVLDPFAESFEWSDEETSMSGNVQLRRPDVDERGSLPVARGHRIRCRVLWGGHWYTVWTMRCAEPETTLDAGGVKVSVDLADDLATARRGRRRFIRRRTKRHPHGYLGHRVLREEARKEGVRLGAVAECTHPMARIDVTGSLVDLATSIYAHERQKSGRRFVIRMRDGRLEVVPLARNRVLYVLRDVKTATVALRPKVANPVTVLVGNGHVGKGAGARKVRYAEHRRSMVERFGYVRREKDYGRVDSLSDLRGRVRRDLAAQYRVDLTADVEYPGIPFIRRGDGVQVPLDSEGFEGARAIAYCTAAQHQVQGESYTSTASFTSEDPYLKDRERREREARARKRRRQP